MLLYPGCIRHKFSLSRHMLALLALVLLAPALLAQTPGTPEGKFPPARDGARDRARDLGVPFDGTPGPFNAITDVAGIEVGYKTLISGEGRLVVGQGPVRTGVTAILPRGKKNGASVFAGFFAGNGNGDLTGTHWIEESGVMETPILITNTLSVGVVRDAAAAWMTQQNHPGDFWYPVVGETADALLNDIKGQHVTKQDALDALNSAASGPVPEGNVGGGTGMLCNGFKGGSGTSSRRVSIGSKSYTLGVFVQCNYGGRNELRIAGIPVSREMKAPLPCFAKPLDPLPDHLKDAHLLPCDRALVDQAHGEYAETKGLQKPEQGSIIVIVATDAPLTADQLKRLARRVSVGLGRAGTILADSSGDLFLAFSTANQGADDGNSTARTQAPVSRVERLTSSSLNPLFLATVQATEESVDNAMVAAKTMIGADYILFPALPHAELQRVLSEHKLLTSAGQK
ncbi:MAG: P1 family peptidase [Acidobacteriaceae bacterium]